jgi:hypothetical protein
MRCPLTPKSGHSAAQLVCPICDIVLRKVLKPGASHETSAQTIFLHLAASAAALRVLTRPASALDYPTRPAHVIVPGRWFDRYHRAVLLQKSPLSGFRDAHGVTPCKLGHNPSLLVQQVTKIVPSVRECQFRDDRRLAHLPRRSERRQREDADRRIVCRGGDAVDIPFSYRSACVQMRFSVIVVC